MFFCLIARFSLHVPAGRHSDSNPHSRARLVPLCAHDYGAVCMVQAALQTATNRCCMYVVNSHKFVSCGNGGTRKLLLSVYPRPWYSVVVVVVVCIYVIAMIDLFHLCILVRLVHFGEVRKSGIARPNVDLIDVLRIFLCVF